MNNEPKITGKQVWNDCVTLARDLGLYIVELGRRLADAIRSAAEKNEPQDDPTVARTETA